MATLSIVANKVWITDITYPPTHEGSLYLAAEMDLYRRRNASLRSVLGKSMSRTST